MRLVAVGLGLIGALGKLNIKSRSSQTYHDRRAYPKTKPNMSETILNPEIL
jgi:hypothetical protein